MTTIESKCEMEVITKNEGYKPVVFPDTFVVMCD